MRVVGNELGRMVSLVPLLLMAADGGTQAVRVQPSKPDAGFYTFQNGSDAKLTFISPEPNNRLEFPEWTLLNIGSPPIVTVNLKSGAVKYAPNYTPDEAARVFWEALGKEARCREKQP